MSPVKTRASAADRGSGRGNTSGSNKKKTKQADKASLKDSQDGDDFYGMRELKHQLAGMNLMLKDTIGDGNCLFRACADQLMGSDKDHGLLRQEVCLYLEENADHFKSFLDDETVEAHVAHMRKNGTYGGNVELVAIARLKKVDVKVYQPGFIYVIEGIHSKKGGLAVGQRPTLHVAYHSWEHYSSIRNIEGPHDGLPEINPRIVGQGPLRKLTDKDPPRAIEKEIMKTTGIRDLQKVREKAFT
ncbi:OTU domain-containing protein 3 [Entomortierella parvispora]|uniref:OTU domain-containing protein 3 n=1 Tax=Entomortierella parvispora TaxID=205924 RepID=A0A9P3HEX6_9FUNG|nr:OTU domain-containing protein 3 [Entomortierella parvispora]